MSENQSSSSLLKTESVPATLLFFSLYVVLFLVVASFTLTLMMSPYIVGELGGSNDITTYTITFFALGNILGVPLGSPLADRIGVRRLFVACLLFFAFFNFVCTCVNHYPLFLGMRFLQGFVSGPFYILIHRLFNNFVPKEKTDTFTTITVTLFAVTPVIGACWGGWIAYDYHWKWCFYVNTGLILLVAALISKILKSYQDTSQKHSFDVVGYLFYWIGIFTLGFTVYTGQELDWFRSPWIITLAAIGLPSLGFFILWEIHHPYPILNLRLLKNGVFAFALFNLGILFSTYFGMIILLALWLSLDVNYTPIWIGLLLGSMAVAGLFPTFLIRNQYPIAHYDPRIPLGIAIVFFAVSCFHTTIFDVDINFGRIAFSRVIAGFGLAFFLPPLIRLLFRTYSAAEGESVMTLFQVVRGLSSSLGGAIYTTIWQRRQIFYHDRMGGDLTPLAPATQEFFTNAKAFHLEGDAAAAQLNYFLDRRSTSLALDDCFYLMAWIMVGLLALLLASFLFRKAKFIPEQT